MAAADVLTFAGSCFENEYGYPRPHTETIGPDELPVALRLQVIAKAWLTIRCEASVRRLFTFWMVRTRS